MPERVSFETNDGVQIVGDWVAAPTTLGAVILIHMMPANRRSWADFQVSLAKRGLASLAIDLRGHGESTVGPEGSAIDFKNFTDAEHQSSLLDVIAAYQWLTRRGFEKQRIALVGASIGANLAAQFLLEEPGVPGAALLSPGRNYRGTNIVNDIRSVLPEQSVWIAASEGDDQISFEASREAHDIASCNRKTLIPLKAAGHGTAMLVSHPEVGEQLADWLKETTQGV